MIAAVAPVAGNAPIVFIASPAQAAAIRLRYGSNFTYEVFASSSLSAGIVVCVATNALVSAVDPAPKIESSVETVLHMEDTTPAAITTNSSSYAFPVRSVFQTNSIALKLRMEVSWALRNASGLAWTTSTTW